MAKQQNNNCFLDFIYKTPKKLKFSSLYRYYFDFILRLLYRVILIDNIPETVSETFLKLILYTQGKICFLKARQIDESQDELLALNCSRAEMPNVYYIPRKVLVTNPRLLKSYNLTPGEDCELVYLSESDKYNMTEINGGLFLLIERTATMLADNDISINIAQKNTRLVNLVSGDTQNTVDSIRAAIASMYEGDPTIIVKSSLIDKLQGIPILQNTSNSNLVELIEVQQYIISHFYESIGLCTHDQMKKERLVTAEINDNLDLAFLNIDDILISIQEGLDRVNAMFGTNMKAYLNPIIERQRDEAAAAAAAEDPPADNADEDPPAEEEPDPADDNEPEPASSPGEEEEDAAPDDQEEPEEEEADEPEQQSGQEEDAAPEDPEEPEDQSDGQEEPEEAEPEAQEVDITITGDNNTIIITGGDDDGSTEADDLPDVGSDNDE